MLAQTGYLESMTPAEREIMLKVKNFLKEKHGVTTPKVWNRWFILRFCRARKFDYEKIVLMINKYMDWAKKEDMEHIGELNIHDYDFLKTVYSHGYYGIDKLGRPIYIEEVKKMKPKEIFEKYTDDQLSRYYIQSYERMIHIIFPECSRVAGRRIDSSCAIMDIKDVALMSLFSGKVKAFMKIAMDIAQDYYPECLGSMYIINAGFLFSGIWAVCKGWLDVKTQKKINIISGKGKEELAAVIELENLPTFLGGKCEKELKEDHGPWEAELHKSYQNKTVFHSNPELIEKYYWDAEEHQEYKTPQN